MLHWWTSGGEARAVEGAQVGMGRAGQPVERLRRAGQGGKATMTVLKSRAWRPARRRQPTSRVQAARSGAVWASCAISPHGRTPRLVPAAAAHGAGDPEPERRRPDGGAHRIHRVNWLGSTARRSEAAGAQAPPTGAQFVAVAEQFRRKASPARHRQRTLAARGAVRDGSPRRRGKTFYRKAFLEQDSAT